MRETVITILASIVLSSTIFAAVHQQEYVTKAEVYAYYDECKRKLDSFTSLVSTGSEADIYIYNLINQNKRAKQLHDDAVKKQEQEMKNE